MLCVNYYNYYVCVWCGVIDGFEFAPCIAWVKLGHVAGIASLLLYPEDESGDSTQPEDEDSEAGETDEQEGEGEPPINDSEPQERRSAPPARPNLAPQNMLWAIRWVYIQNSVKYVIRPKVCTLYLADDKTSSFSRFFVAT